VDRPFFTEVKLAVYKIEIGNQAWLEDLVTVIAHEKGATSLDLSPQKSVKWPAFTPA
jgi:hypothetical protein